MSTETKEFSIKSIFQQAQSGALKMHSVLGTRDESKQVSLASAIHLVLKDN